MKYGIIIQARASSNRLPNKVLKDIEGKPMLLRQVKRLSNAIEKYPIIVATSNESSDDKIANLCSKNDIKIYRGSLSDVMQRFIECAEHFNLDYFVRVGGDDPLIDPDCCLKIISLNDKDNYDLIYASHRKGWPYGAACELISVKSLKKVHSKNINSFYKEHTIPYFFDNPKEFKIKKLNSPKSLLRPDYYLTVDYPEDLNLIREIFKHLQKKRSDFTFKEVINLIDNNSHLLSINRHLHKGFES